MMPTGLGQFPIPQSDPGKKKKNELEPEQETPLPEEETGEGDTALSDEKNYEEQPDGSVVISFPTKKPPSMETEFYVNLATVLPEDEMQALSTRLLERVEADKLAREKRDKMYKEGLERTGLDGHAPGGANFDGASRTVHPMLVEACIDFSSSALRELFPPDGPTKTKIEGKTTQEKLVISERQKNLLNWQITSDVTEFIPEMEQLLTQLPMGGSQYLKIWHEKSLGRWTCEFVPIDDVYLPYATTDFYTSQRITHVQRITRMTLEDRVESGFYRDVNVPTSPSIPEQSESKEISDKIEGKSSDSDNIDDMRMVYEIRVWCQLSADDDEQLPYLVSIDELSGKVLGIYRNWEEEDPDKAALEWMVEWGFLPWRGAYKIGLPHVIGTLATAATGTLRALLDSGFINNFPGGVVLKGSTVSGQNTQGDAQQFIEIEGPVGTTDVRQILATYPYNPPSPTLFQLLGWLDSAGKGVVTTAEEKISEASNQMPVGTALALIEQGSKVYSSIHARMHRSMRKTLEIISRLNRDYLSAERQKRKLDEVLATREDFANTLGVIPVSDPNIFSEGQRYAQTQMVMQLSEDQRVQYNAYEIHKWALMVAKIPNIDRILPAPKTPKEMNAVVENMNLMMGQPVIAFPDQDHPSHIETHIRFAIDPLFTGDPQSALKTIPHVLEHIRQHIGFFYTKTVFDLASQASGVDLGDLMKSDKKLSPNIDRLLAAASKKAQALLSKLFEPVSPMLQQLLQVVQMLAPPQPPDPAMASVQAAQAETQRKEKQDQASNQLNVIKEQRASMESQARMSMDQKIAEHRAAIEGAQFALEKQAKESALAIESMLAELQKWDTERTTVRDDAALELDARKVNLDAGIAMHEAQLQDAKLAAEVAEPGNQIAGA